MNFFKKTFSKISETFKKLVKKFPVTLIIVAFATIFATIDIKAKSEIYKKVMVFCTIFATEAFFVEMWCSKKKMTQIIGYVVSALISIGLTTLLEGKIALDYRTVTTRITAGYLIILTLIAMYRIIKEKDITFEEYILKVFSNMFNSTITYLVLNIGFILLIAISVTLLFGNEWGNTLGRMEIMLLGLFYIPALLNSVWDVKEKEANNFIKGLVKTVLLPLVAISMVIIYAYIIKILVLRQMPSNVIFRILAGIFIIAFPVWSMAKNFKEDNKIIGKLVAILPYAYMPFILLEIYSLYTRIAEFGITPVRYFGILFIIMQVIILVLSLVKKSEKLPQIYMYGAVLALIAFILPLNYSKTSILSQRNILRKEFPENARYEELSEEAKRKIYGAYNYLIENNEEKYIPENVKEHKEELKNNSYYHRGNKMEYIYVGDFEKDINIEKYSRLATFEGKSDGTGVELYSGSGKTENIDLNEFMQNAISSGDPEKYIEQNRIVKLDEGKDLCISYLSASYYIEDRTINFISITGLVLYK